MSLFQKLFQKENIVDQEKINNQVLLSFEHAQFDKYLFSAALNENYCSEEYQTFVKRCLTIHVEDKICVADEIKNLEDYLFFYKKYNVLSLFYTLDIRVVDVECQFFKVSPFILFPLLMNALYHGYNSMEKFPVRIRIYLYSNSIKMEVSNRVNHYLINQEDISVMQWFKTRLEALYPGGFSLFFNSNSNLFKATLILEI